ncbi:GPR endopeptidase [Thermicanus aegyptius]|uniref:GPR endopeptidase n=1 Tax=Thermicanus aegyptius TaxID=94009 RepID=UPI0004272479|nr:GPR endopeptidase [Thermicanus aegyptius]
MRKGTLDLSRYSVRTDLAIEAHQMAQERMGRSEIPGVKLETEDEEEMRITRVHVLNEEGAKAIGKIPGRYVTMEIPSLRKQDSELNHRVINALSKVLVRFMQDIGIPEEASCLIVGLGNWNVTPDSLGPTVVENVLVTRHLFELMPDQVEKGYRKVSALSPGVLGTTGIETGDVVLSIVKEIKPDFVVAVDALASRNLARVNTTIQIADTGIHPGSGIGNKRKAISQETLGIPALAIGVPTVVDAVSVASDTIDYLLKHLGRQLKESRTPPSARSRLLVDRYTPLYEKPPSFSEEDLPNMEERVTLMGMVGELNEEEKRSLIREVLQPMGYNLIVTPKEVDAFIEEIGNILANGLNRALHKAVNAKNVTSYTH